MKTLTDWKKLRQLNIFEILLAFGLPSGFAFFGFRYVLPLIVEKGYPKVLMWGLVASIMLLILSLLGLILTSREARANKISLTERLLLKNPKGKEWLICLGILIGGLILSSLVSPAVEFFSKIPGLSIPDYMPFWLDPSIDAVKTDMAVLSPGYPLQGNVLVVLVMSVTLLLNIVAEEVYFRAWLLPKMQSFGKWSWVLNGTLFALYHTFQLWLFPMLLIVSLATTLTVYISKSILPALVTHFVANFLMGILGVLVVVFG